MAKKTVDPLEDAKVEEPVAETTVSDTLPAPDAPMSKKAKAAEPDLPPPAPVAPVKVSRYQVQTNTTISNGGGFAQLRAGDVVSAASHGEEFIARLQACGVALKELSD